MKYTLSIQIPTLNARKKQFNKLHESLLKQKTDEVEIIFESDNKEISIGAKRERLLMRSNAKYFVQVDDDDSLADDYIAKVLIALKQKPDCIGYLESVIWNGEKRIACHSIRYDDWADKTDGYDYVRTPFFKDVIRVNLAQGVGVNDMRYGEDHDFAKRIKPFLKKEVFINELMYFYSHSDLTEQESNERYGIK